MPASEISDIAHTIQLAVAPVFLLAAVGQILNVLAGRIARVVDRSRAIERDFTANDHPDHPRQVWELRQLDRRIAIVNLSILLCTGSAILICLVVAGLFVAALADLAVGRYLAVAFAVAMLLLLGGLIAFVFEVRLALRTVRVRDELLERQ